MIAATRRARAQRRSHQHQHSPASRIAAKLARRMAPASRAQEKVENQEANATGDEASRAEAAVEAAVADAHAVHLRYVSDSSPGIRRERAGHGFRFVGVRGRPVRDAETLARIHGLVIPPAWTDVWIC